jgi:hypothetical protein
MKRDLSILTFDEAAHRYFVGGRASLSVTQILELSGITDFSTVNKDLLDRACKFGRASHRATELHDLGILDKSSLDAALVPYLESWKSFVAFEISEMVEIEKPIWSTRFSFAGTPDRIAKDKKGRLVLLDIKTSTTLDITAVALQTAGYSIAWEELEGQKIARRMAVLLGENGFKVWEGDDCGDRDDFIACARVAAYKFKNKIQGVRQ